MLCSSLTVETCLECLVLADMHNAADLKVRDQRDCKLERRGRGRMLCSSLTVETCLECLVLADMHNAADLKVR